MRGQLTITQKVGDTAFVGPDILALANEHQGRIHTIASPETAILTPDDQIIINGGSRQIRLLIEAALRSGATAHEFLKTLPNPIRPTAAPQNERFLRSATIILFINSEVRGLVELLNPAKKTVRMRLTTEPHALILRQSILIAIFEDFEKIWGQITPDDQTKIEACKDKVLDLKSPSDPELIKELLALFKKYEIEKLIAKYKPALQEAYHGQPAEPDIIAP